MALARFGFERTQSQPPGNDPLAFLPRDYHCTFLHFVVRHRRSPVNLVASGRGVMPAFAHLMPLFPAALQCPICTVNTYVLLDDSHPSHGQH